MNDWQLAQQLKYLLEAATWPDGDADPVFGSVTVTSATDEETFGLLRMPYVLLNVGESSSYPDEPGFYSQSFSAAVGVKVAGGQFGQQALIGGARTGGQGGSQGRGLLEVGEEFLKAVGALTGADGVNAACKWQSAAGAAVVQGIGYVNQRSYRIECAATMRRYYHPPANLTRSGGTVSWVLPPDRWDRYKIILRRASGTTPPSSPTDGTGVTLASDLATSVADATAAPVSWAIFCAYDEKHNGTPDTEERYSESGTDIPGTTYSEAS